MLFYSIVLWEVSIHDFIPTIFTGVCSTARHMNSYKDHSRILRKNVIIVSGLFYKYLATEQNRLTTQELKCH